MTFRYRESTLIHTTGLKLNELILVVPYLEERGFEIKHSLYIQSKKCGNICLLLALTLRLVLSFRLVVAWALQKLVNGLLFLLKDYWLVAFLHFG